MLEDDEESSNSSSRARSSESAVRFGELQTRILRACPYVDGFCEWGDKEGNDEINFFNWPRIVNHAAVAYTQNGAQQVIQPAVRDETK